jgi:hypothetical protein
VLMALVAACSSPASSGNGGSANGPDVQFGGFDTVTDTVAGVPDALQDGGTELVGDDDAMADGDATDLDALEVGGDTDVDAGEISVGGCDFPASPAKGENGATCSVPTDCDSGLCVDSPTGRICTTTCSDCCPSGFKCATYKGGVDPVTACLPAFTQLCRPCQGDSECAGDDGALCVTYGKSGSFCAAKCDTGADCPDGFACQASQGSVGAGKQCVKKSGECACSPAATAAGASTVCVNSNASGTCTGVRKCTLAGLTPCTADTPSAEACDGADNDCNGKTDEAGAIGCSVLFSDADGDGYGKAGSSSQCLCTSVGLFTAATAGDCDDANKSVNGGAVEVCDSVDNNCDGKTDEGCDDDGDGFCDASVGVIGSPNICPKGKGDCDDASASVHTGQTEQCGNGVDDNCDGLTDSGPEVSGCVPFYLDGDGDGYGTGMPVCACAAAGLYTTAKTGDCDDVAPNVNPGKTELCGNGADDNCNGQIDEAGALGCTPYYADSDGDGFGVGSPSCLCTPDAGHTAVKGGDCNDQSSSKYPGAAEVCNGADDDCDGVIDPVSAGGCTLVYPDGDGDGYGVNAGSTCVCVVPATGFALVSGDCNDSASAAHPGGAEICDGLDNNCNGLTDEAGTQGCTTFYLDNDGDGFGQINQSQCLCVATGAYSASKAGDCNDQAVSIGPAVSETCDGIDNNCNGQTDESGALGCTVYAADNDGDGYGAIGDTQCLCAASGAYTASKATDCNDQSMAVHPGVDEACDGIDNNCDGLTDPNGSDGCKNWYLDQDGDGYGTFMAVPVCTCGSAVGYAALGGDCNDQKAAVHPGAIEACNGYDDDCDGSADGMGSQGCVNYYTDSDQDGYGVGTGLCLCSAIASISATQGGDCNDGSTFIHPGAAELCNGFDDNCDGQVDEGVTTTYYSDNDGDGWGTSSSQVACGPSGKFTTALSGDCQDANAAIHPNATEVCNGVDDNCNGQVDDGIATATYFYDGDGDGDGYGTSSSQVACGPSGKFTTALSGDCQDANAAIHPNATEVCNGVDDNCSGVVDEGLATQTYYTDADDDGYGTTPSAVACGPSGNIKVTTPGDCNDGNAAVYPGHAETCSNSLDDNCNGSIDEGCALCLTSYSNALTSLATGWAKYNNTDFSPYYYPYSSPYTGTRLVPDSGGKKGQLYYVAGRIAAAKSVISYKMAMGGYPDGMALNIINVANQTALESYIATAGSGGCMGFGSNSAECGANPVSGLHVKMDTHDSNSGDHNLYYEYGVTFNGDPGNSPSGLYCNALSKFSGYVDDGEWHTYVVTINGTSISTTCDGETMFSGTMPSTFAGGYVGFSAGTGGSYDEFDIRDFSITQTSCP